MIYGMRKNAGGLLAAASLMMMGLAAPAQAAVVAGTELNIGNLNTVSATGDYAGAIGTSNGMHAPNSLAVGYQNTINGNGSDSFAVGANNYIQTPGCVAIGYGNMYSQDDYWGNAENSLQVGQSNFSFGVASLIVGINSSIELRPEADGYSLSLPRAAMAMGEGVTNHFDHSLVVGKFNAYYGALPPLAPTPLFVVGNGASTSSRSNALEVWEDGRVKMVRQGDILMGEFGTP